MWQRARQVQYDNWDEIMRLDCIRSHSSFDIFPNSRDFGLSGYFSHTLQHGTQLARGMANYQYAAKQKSQWQLVGTESQQGYYVGKICLARNCSNTDGCVSTETQSRTAAAAADWTHTTTTVHLTTCNSDGSCPEARVEPVSVNSKTGKCSLLLHDCSVKHLS